MSTRIQTWFTSDLHLGHLNILKFSENRRRVVGFQSLDEVLADPFYAMNLHDEWLVDMWNSAVSKEDIIYILGDVCLNTKEKTEKFLQRLKGRKFLIIGNHDKSCKGLENYFQWVGDIKEAKFNNNQYDFIDPNETFTTEMCHYPLLSWNRRGHGSTCLMGHCHGALDDFNTNSKELRVDVGIDGKLADCGLISLEKVYNHFVSIRESEGCKNFQEYADWKIQKGDFEYKPLTTNN